MCFIYTLSFIFNALLRLRLRHTINDQFPKLLDMQRVVESKQEINKKLKEGQNFSSKLHKISFHLKYHSFFGQEIFIYGNHSLLGDGKIEKAVPLSFLNDSYWVLHLNSKLPFDQDTITYQYFIKNPDGIQVFDWGEAKSFSPNKIVSSELILIDTWNDAGAIENTFYTEPFANVLLKQPDAPAKSKTIDKDSTHFFRVKAPLLKKHQTICIIGEDSILGKWDVKKALPLTKVSNTTIFEIDLNLKHCNFPFVYKYGVYDTSKNKFIDFELDNNRVVFENASKDSRIFINDGFVHLNNTHWKGAGVAIPVFSLRSKKSMGVGEFADIKLLADWSKKIGLKLIQLLPLNDTTATHTWTDSYPYAAISAFALHPMFIRIEDLMRKGQEEIVAPYLSDILALNALTTVDYEAVMNLKWKLLSIFYKENGKKDLESAGFKKFFKQNAHWLNSYSAFSYLRELYGTIDFNTWPTHAVYDEAAIESLTNKKSSCYQEIAFYFYVQYHLHLQLSNATKYAHKNGIIVKGDIPIGVYRYGADAWQHPHLFNMNLQAGAPPDDFGVKGQNWGFPTYNWEAMAQNNFQWWKLRFEQMSYYFDAFRIDHILGFFRIWSIPMHAVEGILGHFIPAIPINLQEFESKGMHFDMHRLTKPFINESILFELVGYDNTYLKNNFLQSIGDGMYDFLPNFETQKQIEAHFSTMPNDDWHQKIKMVLFDLISNVILLPSAQAEAYHFRFNIEGTSSFKYLDEKTKAILKHLYLDYFFHRQEQLWEKEAMQKLPMLKRSTNMLICGEDLGLVPACLPPVLKQLGILSLEVQRMPKATNQRFFNPKNAPYLSVVTPSSHDTSTLRGWWEENKEATQVFFNQELGKLGDAPKYCEPWINKVILIQHLHSPAIWAIFQLQDFLGIDEVVRRKDPNEERINVPANPKHYWRYRMHLNLEDLIQEDTFNKEWNDAIQTSGR